MDEINNPDAVFIGVAIPGETPEDIAQFRETYGVNFDIWIDDNNNYRKLVEPGGRQFPIDCVIDKKGIVTYLENDYFPGEAVAALKKALAAP